MPLFNAQKGSPTTIGGYELLEEIADGGMGTLYKGRAPGGGLVAIKLVSPALAGNEKVLKRFEQEFRAASTLDHPNIVRALDQGYHNGVPYLVMEFVDGESLGQRIDRVGRLPEEEAVAIVVQVGEALEEAHQRGMVHRDVKPDNVLLAADGRAKLADFGLVKDHEAGMDLTRPGSGLGTPNFMAPEQFNDARNAGPRCDVYSLGATLYMALTGELPFRGKNALQTLQMKMRYELVPPRKLVAGLSEQVERTVCRAMSVNPEQRPASCREFVELLIGRRAAQAARAARAGGPPAGVTGERCVVLAGRPELPPQPLPLRPGKERRAARRRASGQEGVCYPVADAEDFRWPARFQDVSSEGLGLVVGRRFEPGTALVVQLRGGGHEPPRPLVVRVVRVTPLGARQWFLGCTLGGRLDDAEMPVFL